MSRIRSFLTYASGAEEAAEMYVGIFPNSRIHRISRYTEGGPATPGSVMTVEFELDGHQFVALNGGPHFSFTEGYSISVECDTQEEIDNYWDQLLEGGEAKACGWLADRFGVSWQINAAALHDMLNDDDPVRVGRVMQVMMGMQKLVLADLQAAYDDEG